MSKKILTILSVIFGTIPIAGELFLFISSRHISPTLVPAISLALLLFLNLAALRFHGRMYLAKSFFCVVIFVSVAGAITADGGIDSPLWFFQLLVVFGSGYAFGKYGALVAGASTLIMAIVHFVLTDSTTAQRIPESFMSIVSSTIIFTALGYLYEKEKENRIIVQRTEELNSINEELRQFAYRTSHDLKAPLTTIKRLARIITEDLDDSDIVEAKNNAAIIEKRAANLETLMVNVLNLTKSDIDTVDNESIDLIEIVSNIKDRLQSSYNDAGVSIEVETRHSGELLSSEARFNQILEILISNAIRYSDPEKSSKFVKITSWGTNKNVSITVEDNGLGIPKEYADKLFTMFARFHPDVASGSGLGLYIVKKHADKLGATISYNRTQDGSCFKLTLRRT